MDVFFRACGLDGPLQVDVEEDGGSVASRRSFDQPFVLVGRDPRADLVLDHPDVSRRHAYLQVVDGGVYCSDLESRTGTHWESGPSRSGWLSEDRGIRVGPYTIRIAAESGLASRRQDAPSPLALRPEGADHLLDVLLRFQLKMTEPTLWRMRRVLAVIGSSTRCKVRLADPSVSAFHCSLLRTPSGLFLVDLLGRGGVTVNGGSVRWAHLKDGDELGVGYVSVRVRFEAPSPGERAYTPDPDSSPALPAIKAAPGLPQWEPGPGWLSPTSAGASLLSEPISGAGELPASALVLVMNHFSQMHQQMLEQFNQSTMMMFRMLGRANGSTAFREELERLAQITRDLQSLKAELAAKPAAALAHAAPVTVDAPARPEAAVAANGAAPAAPFLAAPDARPRPNGAEHPAETSLPPAGDGPEAHEWVYRQIVEFQNEQQSRWQKIRELVLGKS
jgi:pSer/pThr/pTyr-binding forkhead associated (FHA) protein